METVRDPPSGTELSEGRVHRRVESASFIRGKCCRFPIVFFKRFIKSQMVEVLPNFARPLESLEAGHGWFGTPQGSTQHFPNQFPIPGWDGSS